jgi:periplasmic protein TonB
VGEGQDGGIKNLLLGGHMGNLIPDMDWENVVFEGRNKDYGAYRIRYDYPNHLTFSAIFVISLFLSVLTGHQLLNKNQIHSEGLDTGTMIPIVKPDLPPDIEMDKVTKSTGAKYAVPEVTKKDVTVDQQMPTYDQALNIVNNPIIDKPVHVEGTNEIAVIDLPSQQLTVEKMPDPPPVDVIKNPEFPGGMAECAKWLSRHLEYPAMAVRMGIEGKVVVEFTVAESGRISDATIIEGLHRLCDQEAIRLVKSMPVWTPGEKNGVKTTRKYTLPVRFVLQ